MKHVLIQMVILTFVWQAETQDSECSGDTFKKLESTRGIKDRHFQSKAMTQRECEATCRSEKACWGFTFYTFVRADLQDAVANCVLYLSASVYLHEDHEGSDHFIREGCPQYGTVTSATRSGDCKESFIQIPGKTSNSGTLHPESTTFASCRSTCVASDKCVCFEYDRVNKHCYLMDSQVFAEDLSDDINIDHFVKCHDGSTMSPKDPGDGSKNSNQSVEAGVGLGLAMVFLVGLTVGIGCGARWLQKLSEDSDKEKGFGGTESMTETVQRSVSLLGLPEETLDIPDTVGDASMTNLADATSDASMTKVADGGSDASVTKVADGGSDASVTKAADTSDASVTKAADTSDASMTKTADSPIDASPAGPAEPPKKKSRTSIKNSLLSLTLRKLKQKRQSSAQGKDIEEGRTSAHTKEERKPIYVPNTSPPKYGKGQENRKISKRSKDKSEDKKPDKEPKTPKDEPGEKTPLNRRDTVHSPPSQDTAEKRVSDRDTDNNLSPAPDSEDRPLSPFRDKSDKQRSKARNIPDRPDKDREKTSRSPAPDRPRTPVKDIKNMSLSLAQDTTENTSNSPNPETQDRPRSPYKDKLDRRAPTLKEISDRRRSQYKDKPDNPSQAKDIPDRPRSPYKDKSDNRRPTPKEISDRPKSPYKDKSDNPAQAKDTLDANDRPGTPYRDKSEKRRSQPKDIPERPRTPNAENGNPSPSRDKPRKPPPHDRQLSKSPRESQGKPSRVTDDDDAKPDE